MNTKKQEKTYDELLAEIDYLKNEVSNLQLLIQAYQKTLYGTKSEKNIKEVLPKQGSLFQEEELPENVRKEIENAKAEMTVSPKSAKKKNKKKTGLKKSVMKDIETENVVYTNDQLFCEKCNTAMNFMANKTISTEIVYIPGHFKIIHHIASVYKCPCCSITNDNQANIVQLKVKRMPLGSPYASASIISEILYKKFFQGVPFYRQEKVWEESGLMLYRNSMADWTIKCNEFYFERMRKLIIQDIKKCTVLHADETTIQVNKEQNKKANSKSYMWVLASGAKEKHKAVAFEYASSRSSDVADRLLSDFKLKLITDAYSVYDCLTPAIHGGCWSHARRYFLESIPLINNKQDENSVGFEVVALIDKLFKIDREYDSSKTSESLLTVRNRDSKIIIDSIYEVINNANLKVTNSQKLNKALIYALNQKEKLLQFLIDEDIPLSNNLAERTIRSFAVHRKNWLFADSINGAKATASIYTLIETAKLNNIAIKPYLEYILNELPQFDSISDDELRKYLPYSKELPEVLKNAEDEFIDIKTLQ